MFAAAAGAILVALALAVFRAIKGPTVFDRVLAGNSVGTLAILLLAVVGFLILGMMLQAGFSLVALKLLFILALFVFTGPVVTHALAQAALHEGIKPLLAEDRRGRAPAGSEGRRKSIP